MKLPVVAAALLAAAPAAAETRDDGQLWWHNVANGPLGRDWVYNAEFQIRWDNDVTRNSTILARLAAGHQLSKRVTVFQGYVHQHIPRAGRDRNEERSYQQLSWRVGEGPWGSLQARTRFEQRWFSDGSDMGLRARQQLRYEYPIGTGERPVVAVATGELLFNLRTTDYGALRGFEASRTFAGLRVPFLDEHTVEAGYQAQYSDDDAPGSSIAHTLLVTLTLRP
jgi:Protein of unknown function (DUF2490)